MRLEDSQLYLILDTTGKSPDQLDSLCADAIAGGVDVIQVLINGEQEISIDLLKRIKDICRHDDALFLLQDNADLASEVEANGVLLDSGSMPIGQIRAVLGMDALVGILSKNKTDAELGIEVGADYILHSEGMACASVFAALPGAVGLPLFAAGINTIDEARQIVADGIYRFCIHSNSLAESNITEQIAEYSRLLGRCI